MNSGAASLDVDEWEMGGSYDREANIALGFTEAEVASLAVQAYEYAWSKTSGSNPGDSMRLRALYELMQEFESSLRQHLGLFESE